MLLNILVYTLLSCTFFPILFPHDVKFTTRFGRVKATLFLPTQFLPHKKQQETIIKPLFLKLCNKQIIFRTYYSPLLNCSRASCTAKLG